MSKCDNHEVEYGYDTEALMKNLLKMRCLNCGWGSYSLIRLSEAERILGIKL